MRWIIDGVDDLNRVAKEFLERGFFFGSITPRVGDCGFHRGRGTYL